MMVSSYPKMGTAVPPFVFYVEHNERKKTLRLSLEN